MSLEHAEHNEQLCHQLHAEGKWKDWVVTTSFYSALHYIEHRLFPLTVGKEIYNTFDDYFPQRVDHTKNKHDARLKLVQERLRKAHSAYRFLTDTCRTARYYDYNTSPALADAAKLKLAVVKSLCVPAKPAPVVLTSTKVSTPISRN